MEYIYPENLKVTATVWLWAIKDLVILMVLAMIALPILIHLHSTLGVVVAVVFGTVTARLGSRSIGDYLMIVVKYLTLTQYYERTVHYEQESQR